MRNDIKIEDLEGKLLDLRILFCCLFDLAKYYEMETGHGCTTVCLCEIMDEKFKDLMKDF